MLRQPFQQSGRRRLLGDHRRARPNRWRMSRRDAVVAGLLQARGAVRCRWSLIARDHGAAIGRTSIPESNALQAGIDGAAHHPLALLGPCCPIAHVGLGGAPAILGVTPRMRAARFGMILLIKSLLNASQFADQRRSLRSDRFLAMDFRRSLLESAPSLSPAAVGVPLFPFVVRIHHGMPPALEERLPLIGPGAPAACRPAERATRAKTSSRGPNAIALPSYNTIAMFKADSELGRCDTTITMQRPLRRISIARVSAVSPSALRLALGSSRTTRKGSPNTARARPRRWRWPADRDIPPSPMRVEYPSGRRTIISCAPATRAAFRMASEVALSSKRAMFSATVPSNSATSCGR